jgi:Tfp pilus assembly protein PilF
MPDMNIKELYFKAEECVIDFNIDEACIIYTEIIKLDKNNYCAYKFLGHNRKGEGKLEDAIENYTKAIQNREKNDETETLSLIASYINATEKNFYLSGKNNEVDVMPTINDDYWERGDSYFHTGKFKLAISDFEESIRRNENNVYAYNSLGLCYDQLRMFEKAIVAYDKAIELDPDSALPFFNRGLSNYYLNNYEECFANFAIAEELIDFSEWPVYQKVTLLSILTEIDAPLFISRILFKFDYTDNFQSNKYLVSEYINKYAEIFTLLNYIEENKLVENDKFLLLKGILAFYLNDPVICYHIFNDSPLTESTNNLMIYFYQVLSAGVYLKANYEEALQYAVSKVNVISPEITEVNQLYYAGQIMFLDADYLNAIKYFRKCEGFIPAICLQIVCFDNLDKLNERDTLIKELLFLDKHNKGLIQYLDLPTLSITTFEQTILDYTKIRETEQVIPILNEYCEIHNSTLIPEFENLFNNELNIINFNSNADDLNDISDQLMFYKNNVLEKFCKSAEQIFTSRFKDHFILWNDIQNKQYLQNTLGTEIPVLLKNDIEFNLIVDLLDYFYVKGLLENDQRILLLYWSKLNELKGITLSKAQKETLITALELVVDLTTSIFGIKNIIPDFVMFFGVKSSNNIISKLIISYIEKTYNQTTTPLTLYFSDFVKDVMDFHLNKNSKL